MPEVIRRLLEEARKKEKKKRPVCSAFSIPQHSDSNFLQALVQRSGITGWLLPARRLRKIEAIVMVEGEEGARSLKKEVWLVETSLEIVFHPSFVLWFLLIFSFLFLFLALSDASFFFFLLSTTLRTSNYLLISFSH